MGRRSTFGVQRQGSNLFTRSLVDGSRRRWDPRHSKLAAYLTLGGRLWPFRSDSRVLYLGAAQGETLSHLSDICAEGALFGVENSLIPYHRLHLRSRERVNLYPLLADARRPDTYRHIVQRVDVVVQDVAAKTQQDLFLANLEAFGRPGTLGYLMVKPRCIDVTRPPARIIDDVEQRLARSHEVMERRSLHRYAKEHDCLVVRMDEDRMKEGQNIEEGQTLRERDRSSDGGKKRVGKDAKGGNIKTLSTKGRTRAPGRSARTESQAGGSKRKTKESGKWK